MATSRIAVADPLVDRRVPQVQRVSTPPQSDSGYPVSLLLSLEGAQDSGELLRLLQHGLRRRMTLCPGPVPSASDAACLPETNSDPRQHRVALGDLTLGLLVIDGRPLDRHETAVVNMACRILAGCLWHEAALREHWQALLDGRAVDPATVDRMFGLYSWPRGVPVAVLAIRGDRGEPTTPGEEAADARAKFSASAAARPGAHTAWNAYRPPASSGMLHSALAPSGRDQGGGPEFRGLFFSRGPLHAAFVAVPGAAVTDRRAINRLAAAVRKRLAPLGAEQGAVGFGGVAGSPAEIPDLWRRACLVLDWGEAVYGRGCLVDGGSIGVLGLLLEQVPPETLVQHATQRLGPLLAHDQASDGQLMQTLEVFLECGGNANVASQRLFVHYNTLRHRMRRIEDLLGVDLAGLAVRMDVWVSVLVLRIHGQQHRA